MNLATLSLGNIIGFKTVVFVYIITLFFFLFFFCYYACLANGVTLALLYGSYRLDFRM